MKTLQDLKRDAKSGMYEARMVLRCGTTDIPERLQGWRKIIGSNSVAIFLMMNDGRKSELTVSRASLVEYDGEYIRQYLAGFRAPTEKEQAVLDEWKSYASEPSFVAQAEADAYTDGTSTYWTEVAFFSKAGYEYLMGCKKKRGMIYDRQRGMVQDDRIKGALFMEYEVRRIDSKGVACE